MEYFNELKDLVHVPFSVMGGIKEPHIRMLADAGAKHIAMVTEVIAKPELCRLTRSGRGYPGDKAEYFGLGLTTAPPCSPAKRREPIRSGTFAAHRQKNCRQPFKGGGNFYSDKLYHSAAGSAETAALRSIRFHSARAALLPSLSSSPSKRTANSPVATL